ncbi:MAG: hypothetical protein JSV38_00580 [Desulfobacterales bacterium]|nr:MAG: hypothetical protein JSV38_00580 [Desulfobacterales bacterium]
MQLKHYLTSARLNLDIDMLHQPVTNYIQTLHAAVAKTNSANDEARLYVYKVPKVSPDGSCSISNMPDFEHYDLADILGGRNPITTDKLAILNALVNLTAGAMSVDWLGIYQKRAKPDGSHVLVKLAYRGAVSRAEFSLTPAFATQSNNSMVGMNGEAKIINDIPKYIASDGPYYNCDSRVKAEACMP